MRLMKNILNMAEKFLKLATSKTPLMQQLEAVKPQLAAAAQKIYDVWDASGEDGDWQVGSGGICHLIADAMVGVLADNIPDLNMTTISSSYEVHVFVVAGRTTVDEDGEKEEEYYSIDIRPHVYETGGGYDWKKIPDVVFTPDDIEIDWAEPLELDENGDVREIY
jgi:hypothetical protein